MKRMITLCLTLLLSVNVMAQLSTADRNFAVEYLNATHQNIVDLVEPLPDEAWNYTPEDGGWSVANCLEHILTTESSFFQMAQGYMSQSEADPDFDSSVSDGVLIGMMANRGTRVQTAEQFEPSGKWTTKQEMLDELESSRDRLINYLSNAKQNLRDHKANTPFGEIDTYQVFLLVGAHSQRHTFQMQEVLGEMEGM
ncbi:MAG: DinB family protein [Gracilimonas sp.]|uniref:DinB family protein n=1 Tax=Gracilimonas TaxID=649462 RepID=UPI001B0DDC21|nr:DinB family protein [Gracilimonas sp.]MBO6587033.1 DinB family protein [Gracilimonas sp.]MBO6614479.1 DinB family protein [Gracilimonas sp.]